MTKPQPSEYNSYFDRYIQLVPEGNFIQQLNNNLQLVESFFSSVRKDKQDYRYEPGKWTIREILLHITDTERVMSYRALTISRGDTQVVFPSMDENLFAQNAIVGNRTIENLLEEFSAVRRASIFLFENMSDEQSLYTGTVMKEKTTARALGYIIVGHCLHHMNVVRERYLA
ncbi:MAG: DinB family protein [Chitinophagaceae bacterium]|nr:DinB family protein [Chitinophagaceae bacterium]